MSFFAPRSNNSTNLGNYKQTPFEEPLSAFDEIALFLFWAWEERETERMREKEKKLRRVEEERQKVVRKERRERKE